MADVKATEAYRAIQNAMVQAAPKMVRFGYEKSDGSVSQRTVEPYEIRDGKLFAFDTKAEATRQFKIDKMTNVAVDECFRPRYPIIVPL